MDIHAVQYRHGLLRLIHNELQPLLTLLHKLLLRKLLDQTSLVNDPEIGTELGKLL